VHANQPPLINSRDRAPGPPAKDLYRSSSGSISIGPLSGGPDAACPAASGPSAAAAAQAAVVLLAGDGGAEALEAQVAEFLQVWGRAPDDVRALLHVYIGLVGGG
jgi:hypothetical protein